jgi:ribose transport system permease protein
LTWRTKSTLYEKASRLFVTIGILPFLLVVMFIALGLIERRFWLLENIFNVFRQSSYLCVVAMAQMLVLLTGNYDLSVGANIALGAIVMNLVAVLILGAYPDAPTIAIVAGVISALATGTIIGVINGIGVAVMKVHSFIMTLGMMSVALGIALFLSGGMPVSGVPDSFGQTFAYGRPLGIPAPVIATIATFFVLYTLLEWTRFGRHLYAVGSSIHASRLTGIDTGRQLFLAHVLCGSVTAFGAILLTARVGTGEANMGNEFVLASITACALGGVSLGGGTGRIYNVVLGAFFLTMLTNGMTIARMGSYAQIVADGVLLILAVWAEQLRLRIARYLASRQASPSGKAADFHGAGKERGLPRFGSG